MPFDADQASVAADADCFSYALASTTGEPLLFKGGDFTHTDLRSALPS